MKKRAAGAALLGMTLSMVGCIDIPPVICESDYFCVTKAGIDGRCVPWSDGRKYCIFPSSTCPSSWQWSDRATDELKNKCVDPSMVPLDGGVDSRGSTDE